MDSCTSLYNRANRESSPTNTCPDDFPGIALMKIRANTWAVSENKGTLPQIPEPAPQDSVKPSLKNRLIKEIEEALSSSDCDTLYDFMCQKAATIPSYERLSEIASDLGIDDAEYTAVSYKGRVTKIISKYDWLMLCRYNHFILNQETVLVSNEDMHRTMFDQDSELCEWVGQINSNTRNFNLAEQTYLRVSMEQAVSAKLDELRYSRSAYCPFNPMFASTIQPVERTATEGKSTTGTSKPLTRHKEQIDVQRAKGVSSQVKSEQPFKIPDGLLGFMKNIRSKDSIVNHSGYLPGFQNAKSEPEYFNAQSLNPTLELVFSQDEWRCATKLRTRLKLYHERSDKWCSAETFLDHIREDDSELYKWMENITSPDNNLYGMMKLWIEYHLASYLPELIPSLLPQTDVAPLLPAPMSALGESKPPSVSPQASPQTRSGKKRAAEHIEPTHPKKSYKKRKTGLRPTNLHILPEPAPYLTKGVPEKSHLLKIRDRLAEKISEAKTVLKQRRKLSQTETTKAPLSIEDIESELQYLKLQLRKAKAMIDLPGVKLSDELERVPLTGIL